MKKKIDIVEKTRVKRWTGAQWAVVVILWALIIIGIVASCISIGVLADTSRSTKEEYHLGWWIAKLVCCLISSIAVIYHLVYGRHKKHQWLIPAIAILLTLVCQMGAFAGDVYNNHQIIVILMSVGLGCVAFAFAFQSKPIGIYICLGGAVVCLLSAAILVNHHDILTSIFDDLTTIQKVGVSLSAYAPTICTAASGLAYIFEQLDKKENHQR